MCRGDFWFTLLHELSHLGGDASAVFVDDLSLRDGEASADTKGAGVELEADEWAENALIPPDRWESDLVHESLSPMQVVDLAQQFEEVHPAIVAGRVRHERGNFRLLSQFVGTGQVRGQFEATQP